MFCGSCVTLCEIKWLCRPLGEAHLPEGRHHLVVGEVLVVVFMDGVSARLRVGPPGVLVAVEAELQVFGKRHGPGVV